MSTSSPQLPLNEDELRALDRKQIQALAKKENIKPANATSEKLIKRLLAKFYPPAESEVKIESPSVSPVPQRKSVGFATNPESIPHERSRASPAPFATSPRTPNSGISPIPVPHTSANASTKTSSSGFAASKPVLRHPTLAQPSGPAFVEGSSRVQRQHAVREGQALLHPSYPTQPFTCPTRRLLHTHRLKLHQINDALLNVPSSLSTMERMLPRLERTADTVTQAVDTAAWEGHYLEEMIVKIKYPQGWSNMSPGPAKGKWFALFGDGNKKRHQPEQKMDEAAVKESGRESDGSTVGSLSGNRLKRSREAENGEEEAEPSKRRKSRESSQL